MHDTFCVRTGFASTEVSTHSPTFSYSFWLQACSIFRMFRKCVLLAIGGRDHPFPRTRIDSKRLRAISHNNISKLLFVCSGSELEFQICKRALSRCERDNGRSWHTMWLTIAALCGGRVVLPRLMGVQHTAAPRYATHKLHLQNITRAPLVRQIPRMPW